MRKLLLLLPLVLAGCGSKSDIPNETAYQAVSVQVADPEPGPLPDAVQPALTANGTWTARLTGLPTVLNDVLWSGDTFIAVGDSGVILTSVDGIDWVQIASGTDADLNAISSDGPDIVVVGDNATVLLSTDDGESWNVRYGGDDISLHAVVVNAWQIIVGGRYRHSAEAFMMRSEDRGESWTAVESLPQSGHWSTDLVYAGGMFVAATDIPRSTGGTRVWVSIDGKDWQDIVIWDSTTAGLYTILHDGNRFIVAGDYGAVFTSADGTFWTLAETPFEELSYLSAVWTGSELMVAGGITWWYWWVGTPPFERATGLSSTNGGATWETVDIGGYYQSLGMAWGNGRFVSVGQALPNWGEGAIYTSP